MYGFITENLRWLHFETVLNLRVVFVVFSGRTEVQSVQYGKEKGIKDRVFAR